MYTIATRVKQKMATSVCFPSGLMHINTYFQLKSTACYKNVSRALVNTWHGRLSDGSTVNTTDGQPKYKNGRKLKSAPEAVTCD